MLIDLIFILDHSGIIPVFCFKSIAIKQSKTKQSSRDDAPEKTSSVKLKFGFGCNWSWLYRQRNESTQALA